MPLFSVVIPTHNRARLVSRAIDSVLRQTFEDFEVVVVDDCSTDETRDVVMATPDPRVRLVTLPENRGAAGARNAGIAAARGPLISLLDSDDEYLPAFLERTREALAGTDDRVGFSWAGTQKTSRSESAGLKREQTWRRIWSPTFASRQEAWRYALTHDAPWGTNNGVTVKSFVFAKSGGFDETLRACEDMDIFVRLMRDFDFIVIPEHLVEVHDDAPVRVDAHFGNAADAWEKMYRKYGDDIRNDPKAVRFFLSIIATHCRQAGRRAEATAWALRLLAREPTSAAAARLLFKCLTGLQPAG